MTKNQEVEQILKIKDIKYYKKWAFYENFAVEWVFRGPRGAFSAPAEYTLPLVAALQQAGWKKIQGGWGGTSNVCYIFAKDSSKKTVDK